MCVDMTYVHTDTWPAVHVRNGQWGLAGLLRQPPNLRPMPLFDGGQFNAFRCITDCWCWRLYRKQECRQGLALQCSGACLSTALWNQLLTSSSRSYEVCRLAQPVLGTLQGLVW